jgi:hypothetical protein
MTVNAGLSNGGPPTIQFVRPAWSDQDTQSPNSDDPARGLRRLLGALVVLALVAAGGAFALSQRGGPSPTQRPQPSLFPKEFSEPGFLTGSARLVSSYDAKATARRLTGSVDLRGTAYLVARCNAGTLRIVLAGLTSARPCTGTSVGVVAVNLTKATKVSATVSAPQTGRWGVALYR